MLSMAGGSGSVPNGIEPPIDSSSRKEADMRQQRFLVALTATLALASAGAVAAQMPAEEPELGLEALLGTEISTASKYEQTSREAPASVTVVTAEEIERFGYRTLEEVLQNVRGFYTSNDRNYGYLGVRGFSRPTDYNSRILLQINGHDMNENFYGSMSISSELGFNLDAVERIEIVRGPGSSLYGTGAMFAVVNIIPKAGNATDGLRVAVEAGDFGRQWSSLVYGKELANGVEVSVAGQWADVDGENQYYEEFDDPETNNGVFENGDWDDFFSGYASVKAGGFQALGYFVSREKGIPTAPWDTNFNDSRARTVDEWAILDLKYRHDIGADKSFTVRGYLDDYYYEGDYPYELLYLDENNGEWWGVETELTWDLEANNRLIVGAEFQDHTRAHYRAWDDEEVYFDDDIPYDVVSLYLQDAYQITRDLSLTLGLRYDDFSDVGSSTTPRLALVYHPTKKSTLKALYGEAFRRPNHYEVYFADGLFSVGNPDLEPEEIRTTELVWEQQLSGSLYGTVSVFRYDMENLITGVLLPDELVQFQNIEDVESNGFELELNLRLDNRTLAYLSYSYQETEDQELGEPLTNSPQHLARLGFSAPFLDHFFGGAQLRYESERVSVYDTELDSYLVTDLHFSTRPLFGRTRLWLHLDNLFDEEFETPGGFEHYQDGLRQDGRNYRLGIEYRF